MQEALDGEAAGHVQGLKSLLAQQRHQ
jgi:hypothetical protein